jgi:two-component system sensor histidine kinase TctE
MARLNVMLDSQRRFITDAAHQLRTPVTTLRTQVEVALRTHDPAEMQAIIGKLDSASKRLARLTNQLLDLSRAEAGHSMTVAMDTGYSRYYPGNCGLVRAGGNK